MNPLGNYQQSTRIVGVGERMRDQKTLLKVKPNNSGPIISECSHRTTCRDPIGIHHCIWTLLCKMWWRVLTSRVLYTKVDQWQRIYIMLQTVIPQEIFSSKTAEREQQWRRQGKSRNETKISSHFNVGTAAASVTDTDSQKTLNHS